jgi:adenylate cyclase
MSFTRVRVAPLALWLTELAHVDDGGRSFMLSLVERLRGDGLPLWRCSFTLTTMHPEVLWRNLRWTEDEGLSVIERPYEQLDDPFYKDSPVALLHRGVSPIRVRLTGADVRFPICRDLEALGGTDYCAQAARFSNGQLSYVSWATRAPGGFSDETIAALEELRPFLTQRLEVESAYHATRALLEVYLGRNAAARVRAGAFRRGAGELIDAAIWFCDMRGFTSLSDSTAPGEVVRLLDAYFDRVTQAIMGHGGEVLKFVGDAVLAIFPVQGDPAAACANALAAAEEALESVVQLNAGNDRTLAIGVGLHVGQVMYGNIGARDRLDFTVISSSVNEACRLEALCKTLGTPLAMSEAFARSAKPEDLVDLGEQPLKGVRAPLRVFTRRRHRDA